MTVQYKFLFSADFLWESFVYYRRQLRFRRALICLKWLLAALLGVALVTALTGGRVAAALVLSVVIGALSSADILERYLTHRGLRKSPYNNDNVEIEIGESGVSVKGSFEEVAFRWEAFTKARQFDDGLLLFRGPRLFNWLPHRSLIEPDMKSTVRELVKRHVRDFMEIG